MSSMLYTNGVCPKFAKICSPGRFKLIVGYSLPLVMSWKATAAPFLAEDLRCMTVTRTYFDTVFGIESGSIAKVYTAANYIASRISRTKRPPDVLPRKAAAVVGMVAPRIGFPANRTCCRCRRVREANRYKRAIVQCISIWILHIARLYSLISSLS